MMKANWGKLSFAALGGMSVLTTSGAAHAGAFEVSTFMGFNESFNSDVTVTQGGNTIALTDVNWDSGGFVSPPYWGVRGAYWFSSMPGWGVSLEYTHGKAIADPADIRGQFSRLEFTDGLNLVHVNAVKKIAKSGPFDAYVGAGVGVALPYVEVITNAGAGPVQTDTFELQLTGFAAQVLAGASYDVTDRIGLFGEYKLGYSQVNGDLNGGGTVDTNLWTNQFLFGISYQFGDPSL